MVVVPSRMGLLNRRALLSCLHRLGPASRADLAKESKLSQPTVGKITDDLVRMGILEEVGESMGATGSPPAHAGPRARAGRPGRTLRFNPTRPRFLGIHLDVSETRFALMPACPRSPDAWDLILPTPSNREAWHGVLLQAAAHLDTRDLLGAVLCVPGIVDEATGGVLFSPNLHWTENLSLPGVLHEVWPIPAVLIQELRALALGHQHLDASTEDFLAVDIGEGVGSAAVVGGELYASQLPMSGELGHILVADNTRPCGCGAIGCLETLISSRGLKDSFAAATGHSDATLQDLNHHIGRHGIPSWLAEALTAAGRVIAGALNVLGVRKVVVTGVLNELPGEVCRELDHQIRRGAMWERFGTVCCLFAPRHHTAGMVAAGLDRLVVPADRQASLAHMPGPNGGAKSPALGNRAWSDLEAAPAKPNPSKI